MDTDAPQRLVTDTWLWLKRRTATCQVHLWLITGPTRGSGSKRVIMPLTSASG